MGDNRKNAVGNIEAIEKSCSYYSIKFRTGEGARLYILNEHVFRYYMSPTQTFLDYPKPINEDDHAKIIAKTLDEYEQEAFLQSELEEIVTHYIIRTKEILILFDKKSGTIKIHDDRTNKDVLIEAEALSYNELKSKQTLSHRCDEFFFGGGMQNGRFSHKGTKIEIVNTSKWTDGYVSSPCPFYWSSYGYGILRNTWQKGLYDFGEKTPTLVETVHDGEDFDAYFFINSKPKDILKDYYELTGKPLLLPEYALYESHFNAFNRDYWVEVSADTHGAILFEDGKYYKSYQPKDIGDKKGILESLNGENNNYQFSARAMIDRYKRHDVPLGWFIPNDGYGCGYGQTDSLGGDILNLKQFSDYCKQNGIQLSLWTESNLQPADPSNPKKGERDLHREVHEANVVALKCDEAWIGSGYSFGLSAIETAHNIFSRATPNNGRPMILTIDGWAGTQRYAGIWSGDQKGGEWEYIRFHIPTYIGTGLSGQPIVGSDMDGIYAGGNKVINIRDYQWKTFTPLQLNMDGWGNTPKTPFSYDNKATEINRAYLKLKSILMPYNYSIAFESTDGLPMVRAMFLEFPSDTYAYTVGCQYQYMWGPYILVAPIYTDNTLYADMTPGDSLRDGVYLPGENQIWIDFFTGEKFQGGKVYNNVSAPLWKIPVFIKEGSILPMTNPNNNPNEIERANRKFTLYPRDDEQFNVYEDDGVSKNYQKGHFATTEIVVNKLSSGDLVVTIHKTIGSYETMVKERSTMLQIMATSEVDSIKVAINGEPVQILRAENYEQFKQNDNSYYFDKNFTINPYLSNYNIKQTFLCVKIGKVDVTTSEIIFKLINYKNESEIFGKTVKVNDTISPPSDFREDETNTSIILKWKASNGIDYYEIEKDGNIFTNVKRETFKFDIKGKVEKHCFHIRSVLGDVTSKWSESLNVFPV